MGLKPIFFVVEPEFRPYRPMTKDEAVDIATHQLEKHCLNVSHLDKKYDEVKQITEPRNYTVGAREIKLDFPQPRDNKFVFRLSYDRLQYAMRQQLMENVHDLSKNGNGWDKMGASMKKIVNDADPTETIGTNLYTMFKPCLRGPKQPEWQNHDDDEDSDIYTTFDTVKDFVIQYSRPYIRDIDVWYLSAFTTWTRSGNGSASKQVYDKQNEYSQLSSFRHYTQLNRLLSQVYMSRKSWVVLFEASTNHYGTNIV